VDRCALFVDAGYVLADGAMAVHGTRRRESVSWDYAGLLQLLASQARERSGLPLLRCYWYEATVEGRRNADHDTLADLPGVKLRVAKMRPGRREGVESEIHRDLTTLARNKAVSDAMVVSAEEDLAQVVADVQDLGLRVTLLHIAVDGNWTISRTLRQECDDIVEISSAHLRPYVELISGAEPPHPDERDGAPLIALRQATNGHGQVGRAVAYTPSAADSDNGHQAPPSIYTAPVVAEYQRSAPQLSRSRADDPAGGREDSHGGEPAEVPDSPPAPDLQPVRQDEAPVELPQAGVQDYPGPQDYPGVPALAVVQPDPVPAQQDYAPRPDLGMRPDLVVPQEIYAAPVAVPVAEDQPVELPVARSRPAADLSGYNPGAVRDQLSRESGDGLQPVPAATSSAQIRRLPTRGGGQSAPAPGQSPAGAPPTAAQPALGQPTAGQPMMGQPGGQPPAGQPGAPAMPLAPGGGYAPGRNGSYNGPRPAGPAGTGGPVGPAGQGGPVGLAGPPPPPPGVAGVPSLTGLPGGQQGSGAQPMPGQGAPTGPLGAGGPGGVPGQGPAAGAPGGPVGPAAYSGAQGTVSLADAVQSAHEEGQAFGESVARDAPALWLEAVLARKPRMPSDLEARLLQGSSLPIDFLLHDEVRHALRRGFWDALERARR
jgi:NYN domain